MAPLSPPTPLRHATSPQQHTPTKPAAAGFVVSTKPYVVRTHREEKGVNKEEAYSLPVYENALANHEEITGFADAKSRKSFQRVTRCGRAA